MKVAIQKVEDRKTEASFLDCPRLLYKDDPNWVCPLDLEIRNIFNPKKNKFFAHGEAARWTLLDEKKRPVGRVAAFINEKKARGFEQPTGGVGFFEARNDQAEANLLFDTAKAWLAGRGIEAMDGPINFGENDRFWGLQVEGFSQPFVGMLYNPPYYIDLYENYGFRPYFEQVSRVLDISRPPERFARIAERVAQNNKVSYAFASRKQMDKFAKDFLTIYNDAWRHHPNFTPIDAAQLEGMIEELRFVMVEQMCIFAYVEGEPAGFIICLPDLNQIIKPFRGKPNLIQKLQLLWRKRGQFAWYRKRGILTQGRVIIMGVRPKFQRHGLESGMTITPMADVHEMGFQHIELGWVGDFNPAMQRVLEATGARERKVYRTYRHLFSGDTPEYLDQIARGGASE